MRGQGLIVAADVNVHDVVGPRGAAEESARVRPQEQRRLCEEGRGRKRQTAAGAARPSKDLIGRGFDRALPV